MQTGLWRITTASRRSECVNSRPECVKIFGKRVTSNFKNKRELPVIKIAKTDETHRGIYFSFREFTGEAQLDPDSLAASSLEIVAKAASMEETSSVFTEAQKKIINTELREIVLLPDQYPDIVFRSTSVSGKTTGPGHYDLKIAGNLRLLGVTRPVTIPTKVTVTGNELRAQGDFSIDRSDFKVKATSAFHGLVRVRQKVKFEFDIVAQRF